MSATPGPCGCRISGPLGIGAVLADPPLTPWRTVPCTPPRPRCGICSLQRLMYSRATMSSVAGFLDVLSKIDGAA